MTDKVKKVFELLGVEPNEKFKIKENKDAPIYMVDDKLRIMFYANDGELLFSGIKLFDLLNGTFTIVKLSKKKKLRDLTTEEYEDWRNVQCSKCRNCEECPFYNIDCTLRPTNDNCWINHKDGFSNNFLNQEVEWE